MQVSAVQGIGLDEVWRCLTDRHADMKSSGLLERRRTRQALAILRREIELALIDDLRAHGGANARLVDVERLVAQGELTPGRAAKDVLAAFHAKPDLK